MTSSKTEMAEQRFREAFERLKEGRPQLMPRGTLVSQNNIAKEAGTDPTALRKTRYPALIREIQAWVEINNQAKVVQHRRQAQRRKMDDVKTQVHILKKQRDYAQSQLVGAHRLILELSQQNSNLQRKLNDMLPPPKPLRAKR